MLESKDEIDSDRAKNSLFLCVRSVRFMTEQLVSIVSSLTDAAGNYDSFVYDNRNSGNSCCVNGFSYDCRSRDIFEELPPSICSRSETISTNCTSPSDECLCINDYCHDDVIRSRVRYPYCRNGFYIGECLPTNPKINDSLSSDDLVKKPHKNTDEIITLKESITGGISKYNAPPSLTNMASQTTIKATEDKQSYTTPEMATQTIQADKVEIPEIVIENMTTENDSSKVNGVSLSNISANVQSWDALIRSQIEEVVAKKLSEKLSERIAQSNRSRIVQMLPTLKMSSTSPSKLRRPDNYEPILDLVENNSILGIAFQTEDKRVDEVNNSVRNDKVLSAVSVKGSNDIKAGKRIETKNSMLSQANAGSYRESLPERSLPEDDNLFVESQKPEEKSEVNAYVTHERSVSITVPDDPYLLSRNNTMNMNNYSLVLEKITGGTLNSNELSIYDEFDYVSEVELVSLSNSETELYEISDSYSEVSVYDSELPLNDDLNSQIIIQESQKSGDTILSNEFIGSQSDLSAFSYKISDGKLSSNYIRLSDSDRNKLSTSNMSNQSESSKYIFNIKSINTLSSSVKKRYVRYKSINVTNLERNFSNKSDKQFSKGNLYSLSKSLNYSMEDGKSLSDISSTCMDSCSTNQMKYIPKDETTMNIVRIECENLNCINVAGKMKPTFEVYEGAENLNKNEQNSIPDFDEEIFVEHFHENDKHNGFDTVDKRNVVDVLVPVCKSIGNLPSSYSKKLQSLYCDIIQNGHDDNTSINGNLSPDNDACYLNTLDNTLSHDSRSETIFLQATLEIDNGCSKKTDSKMYKIHFDKNYFSIEDDDNLQLKSENNCAALDKLVSCFDTTDTKDRLYTTVNNVKKKRIKKKLKEHRSQIRNKKKRRGLDRVVNFSFIECYLDDCTGHSSRAESFVSDDGIEVDKDDCYRL